jgi:hypothetical protein
METVGQLHVPAYLLQGIEPLVTHWIAGWVCPLSDTEHRACSLVNILIEISRLYTVQNIKFNSLWFSARSSFCLSFETVQNDSLTIFYDVQSNLAYILYNIHL